MAKVPECCICRKGPINNVSVYRINAKGVAPIWACADHIKHTDADVSPEVLEISKVLEGKRKS